MKKATKFWLILAGVLIVGGCILFGGIMTMLNWDFTKLSTASYSTNSHTVEEAFSHISLKTTTANITFLPSEDSKTTVVCHEPDNQTHTVKLQDDTLVIQQVDTRQWYEYIGIYFEPIQITVYLPQKEYGSIRVASTTGKTTVENLQAQSLDISATTGDISLSRIVCSGDLSVQLTTGQTVLTNISCKNLTSTGTTGSIVLRQVIAAEDCSIHVNTGDIRLEDSDAATLTLKTVTGSVSGTLLTGKTFFAKTTTGHIDVPTTTGGCCLITTTTGSISIRIRSGE